MSAFRRRLSRQTIFSFAHRMRQKTEAQGQDLLLVIDSGDRVGGMGFLTLRWPKACMYVWETVACQHLDVITAGNLELYHEETAMAEFETMVPGFGGNYLALNMGVVHSRTPEVVSFAA